MITITHSFDPAKAISTLKQEGYTVTASAIAAYVRHNCTNYDTFSCYLSTDKAEDLIVATYKAVIAINPALKAAMLIWANTKLKGLIS